MSRLTDAEAEHTLAAVAIISQHGAQLALERVPADAYSDPVAWWTVDAGASLPDDLVGGGDPDPIVRRANAIAGAIEVYPAKLLEWVASAPCMWDANAHFAGRVLAAAERRRIAEEAIAVLEGLGLKVHWDRAS